MSSFPRSALAELDLRPAHLSMLIAVDADPGVLQSTAPAVLGIQKRDLRAAARCAAAAQLRGIARDGRANGL